MTFSFVFSVLFLLSVSFSHLTCLQLIVCKSVSIGAVSVCFFFKAAGKVWET